MNEDQCYEGRDCDVCGEYRCDTCGARCRCSYPDERPLVPWAVDVYRLLQRPSLVGLRTRLSEAELHELLASYALPGHIAPLCLN